MVISVVTLATDIGAGLMFDEREGASTIYILLMPFVAVRIQIFFGVDEIERHRDRRNEGR